MDLSLKRDMSGYYGRTLRAARSWLTIKDVENNVCSTMVNIARFSQKKRLGSYLRNQ